jgi:hypothetical protein
MSMNGEEACKSIHLSPSSPLYPLIFDAYSTDVEDGTRRSAYTQTQLREARYMRYRSVHDKIPNATKIV